jgi:hypothetical protein
LRAGPLRGRGCPWRKRPVAASAASLCVALALTSSLIAAPGRPDPDPDPQACKLLSALDLEPLLFGGAGGVLDSFDFHPAPGLSTCRWDARPRDHAADAVPRTATLAFYHLASPQRAQTQLDAQAHRDRRPSMATTGGGDDAIARPSATVVAARHGADIAVIDATGAELDNPNQIEVRYLLDSLALKAAGASVKPAPWAKPGQVAAWAPIAAAEATGSWSPPTRPIPAGGAALEPLIHLLKTLAALNVAVTLLGTPTVLLLFFLGGRRSRKGASTDASPSVRGSRQWWPAWAGGALLTLMLANAIFGKAAANALIDRFGAVGAATVTGSFVTSAQYNRQDVVGHDVLIRTVDQRVVKGRFRTDDFNVRGFDNTSIYPGLGDVFTVRYLSHHPRDFIIRNDDESPWARKLACARLATWRAEAGRKASFDPLDLQSRNELERASAEQRRAGCSE